jgi:hypothetical protein
MRGGCGVSVIQTFFTLCAKKVQGIRKVETIIKHVLFFFCSFQTWQQRKADTKESTFWR